MSLSRNRQTKMTVKQMRKPEKKLPAIPSTAEIASGTDAEICSDPACTFPAAPLSPSQDSSSDARSCSTVAGSSWRKSRTLPTSGTRNNRAITSTPTAVPSTVMVAASPRDQPVLAITKRTGYSNTSARKIPTNTNRNVSPIAQNAASTPAVAATSKTVRIGRTSSTRRGVSVGAVDWSLRCAHVWRLHSIHPECSTIRAATAAALHADGMKLQASPTRDGSGRLRSVRAARRAAGGARRVAGAVPPSGLRSSLRSAERATKVLVIAAVMTVRKPIPNSITNAATSRPGTFSGTLSPYPTVVVVWIAHQSPEPIDGYRSCSATVIKKPAADGDDDRRDGDHDGGATWCGCARHRGVEPPLEPRLA